MHSLFFVFLKLCQKVGFYAGVAFLSKRLFLIPIEHRRPEDESAFWMSGRKTLLQSGCEARAYPASRPVFSEPRWIVCIHGWSGRGSQFFKCVTDWNQAGYSVLLVDGPGHGRHRKRNPFFLSHLSVFSDLLRKDLEAWGQPIWMLVGHSFGGCASVIAALRGLKPKGVMTVGSPNRLVEVTRWFADRWGLSAPAYEVFVSAIENEVSLKMSDLDTEKQVQLLLGKSNSPSVWIVHDESDKEVPIRHAHEISNANSRVGLKITKDLGHRRILKSQELTKAVLDSLGGFSS